MAEEVAPSQPLKRFRKGALVRVKSDAYQNSVESSASDQCPPAYIFEGPGELLMIKGEYGQVRWRMPVPDVWLRLDQLELWQGEVNK